MTSNSTTFFFGGIPAEGGLGEGAKETREQEKCSGL